MDGESSVDKNIKWVDAKDDFVVKRDEKIILGLYRIVRTYYQFFVGLALGFLLMGLIVK
jgi:hypothetical protein